MRCGFWFCACSGLPIVPEGGGGVAPKRAPVVLAGRRARTVDVHAHCYFQAALDLMGPEAASVLPPVKGVPEHFLQIEQQLATRFAAMDRLGVDLQVLSVNPFWYRKDRDTAQAICRIHNESLAALCARAPKRLAAFASLPMQFPDLAVTMLDEAVRKLGLKGAAIGGNVVGRDFCHPEFHPVLARAQELGVTLFIHPQPTPELQARFKGNGWLANVTGNPLDTTIALHYLIFDGVLERHPKLKILAVHGGGYLPAYCGRIDHAWGARSDAHGELPHPPTS
jgi:predicted TIM-barrel fold metal-dependent hydrolase